MDDNGWDGDDRILFGPGITADDLSFSSSGTDLVVKLKGTDDQIRVSDGLWSAMNDPGNRVDRIEFFDFAEGTRLDMNTVQQSLLTGTPGNDTIVGYTTDDTLSAGAGNDELYGRGGSDTFVFAPGFGQDSIEDFQLGGTGSGPGSDTLAFDHTIFSDQSSALASEIQVGDDVLMTANSMDKLLLRHTQVAALNSDMLRIICYQLRRRYWIKVRRR